MLSKDFELYYYEDRTLPRVELHAHNYYEFYFFLEGAVQMQIGNQVYPVRFGDIMLIPPELSHRPIIQNEEQPYRRFVFWISKDYCNHLLQSSPDYAYIMQYVEIEKKYIFHTDQLAFHSIQSKLMRLLEEMRSNKFGRDAQISVCINDLVLNINRLAYEQNTPKQKYHDYHLYDQLTAYIEEHMDEDLSLDTLAKHFFVSKYHIAHIFKDNIGISIHQYITKKRLSLCKDAISGKMNITDAYQKFGFGDYSSFYRAFKKEFGISPKDFRDMQINLE
jgi:AraC-like DNA-binding protein